MQLREQHLLTIVTLLIGVGQAVQPVCECDEEGTLHSGGKSGWLSVRERRSMGGRTELHNLGMCWVFLGQAPKRRALLHACDRRPHYRCLLFRVTCGTNASERAARGGALCGWPIARFTRRVSQ